MSGHIRSGENKRKVHLTRFKYYYELSHSFPNARNYMRIGGYFSVFGNLRANQSSSEYEVEFRLTGYKMMVLIHHLMIPGDDLSQLPHIFISESNVDTGTVSLCLYRNKEDRLEYSFGDNLFETLIPWAQEWIYFYEMFLITGKWYGNGEHPGKEE